MQLNWLWCVFFSSNEWFDLNNKLIESIVYADAAVAAAAAVVESRIFVSNIELE